ncbi:Uncharacterised protein [Corynebacterium renale]|uniref:hypothetical protein n=1 Tax=Corynebacterium renale TaxID=1724 RepID=UPI000DA2B36A|nr:hypothetical protein [Corynebacterium renale]SQG63654.1 Uncharacterised protein [Corynebacterium renale]STD01392.1 Uncharacterised protein [Corynebacterium renale]
MKKTVIAVTTALAVAAGAVGVTPANAATGSSDPAADRMVPEDYTPQADRGSSLTGSSPIDVGLITGGVVLGLGALGFLYEQLRTGKLVIPGLENIQLPDLGPITGSSQMSSNLSSEGSPLAELQKALSSQQ